MISNTDNPDLEPTTVEEHKREVEARKPKIQISIPEDLELTTAQISPGGITGKGWTMKRKFNKIGRNDPCPCGGDHKAKNHAKQ